MEGLFFGRIDYYFLSQLLRNEEFSSALAYLVDNETYSGLQVIPKRYSIELSNAEITIAIILFVGFENSEYEELKNKPNLHVISFCKIIPEMVEFKNIDVKYYDQLLWLFTIISRSDNDQMILLRLLKGLKL